MISTTAVNLRELPRKDWLLGQDSNRGSLLPRQTTQTLSIDDSDCLAVCRESLELALLHHDALQPIGSRGTCIRAKLPNFGFVSRASWVAGFLGLPIGFGRRRSVFGRPAKDQKNPSHAERVTV